MSNNKQSVKLYTEEQIRNAMRVDFILDEEIDNLINKLTPIELPSDKDTAHLQWIYDRMSNVHGENENYDYMLKFKEIIEQLKKEVKMSNNKQSSVMDENFDYVKSNEKTLPMLEKIYGDCATDKTATFQVPKNKQMSNNKQSSVSQLIAEIKERVAIIQSERQIIARELWIDNLSVDLEKYEAMHKEEIEDAFQEGKWDWAEHITNGTESKDLEQYYNKTFGGNK